MPDPRTRRGLPGRGGRPGALDRLGALLREAYVAPYRRTFARARRDEDDLLMVVVLAESLGVPDPSRFHTLELLPLLTEQVHDWHRRLGMDRSPLEHVSCC